MQPPVATCGIGSLKGLERCRLPSRPNPLWIKALWVHAAQASRGCITVNQKEARLQQNYTVWPFLCPPVTRPSHSRSLGCCSGVTHPHSAPRVILCVVLRCCVSSVSICLQVNALFTPFISLMMRLEPSAPLNLLTYTDLYLSLTHASCYSVR